MALSGSPYISRQGSDVPLYNIHIWKHTVPPSLVPLPLLAGFALQYGSEDTNCVVGGAWAVFAVLPDRSK